MTPATAATLKCTRTAPVGESMPAKRLGRPEEVAAVVLFLASPLTSWVSAQIIGVNGGQGFAR